MNNKSIIVFKKNGLRILIVTICVSLLFTLTSCSVIKGKMYAKDMKYFNKKAIDNIESLIGRSPDEYEDWVFETYSHNDLVVSEPNKNLAVETYKSYISKDKKIRIDFLKGDDDLDISLCIYPNIYYDDSPMPSNPSASLAKVGDPIYYKEVIDYCYNTDADYKQAPLIGELNVDYISVPDKAELTYSYLVSEDGEWLDMHDDTMEHDITFDYKNGTFVAKN